MTYMEKMEMLPLVKLEGEKKEKSYEACEKIQKVGKKYEWDVYTAAITMELIHVYLELEVPYEDFMNAMHTHWVTTRKIRGMDV